MDLFVAWLLFPALLLALCVGCGLLLERVAGRRLDTVLLPVAGFAAIVVAGQFLTLADATAELAAPAIVVLALAGFAVGLRGARGRRLEGWGYAAAAAAFAVYAAPVVLSGEPTIAGFIKLDDTATWLSLTDRIMEHGRDLDGLAPSTYEATLQLNLGDGYPIGAFLPFGVGVALTGTDAAWLIQPYIAFAAALLALCLWSLATPLARSPRLRGAGGVRRRPARTALRLLPLGRRQGGDRRGAGRRVRRARDARPRARRPGRGCGARRRRGARGRAQRRRARVAGAGGPGAGRPRRSPGRVDRAGAPRRRATSPGWRCSRCP